MAIVKPDFNWFVLRYSSTSSYFKAAFVKYNITKIDTHISSGGNRCEMPKFAATEP